MNRDVSGVEAVNITANKCKQIIKGLMNLMDVVHNMAT